MNILPQTRADRIRFACLACLLFGVGVYYRLDRVVIFCLSEKQIGDVVFQSLPRGPLVETIEGVTDSEWSHCGILVQRDGKWMVAEAIGQVRYTPLYLWVVRGRRAKVESYRLSERPENFEAGLAAGIEPMVGRPYDYRYAPEDDEIYCSELVHKAYDRGLGIRIGEWERLGDLNWRPHEQFIRETENGKLPLDRLMVTPVGLTRSPLVRRVF